MYLKCTVRNPSANKTMSNKTKHFSLTLFFNFLFRFAGIRAHRYFFFSVCSCVRQAVHHCTRESKNESRTYPVRARASFLGAASERKKSQALQNPRARLSRFSTLHLRIHVIYVKREARLIHEDPIFSGQFIGWCFDWIYVCEGFALRACKKSGFRFLNYMHVSEDSCYNYIKITHVHIVV